VVCGEGVFQRVTLSLPRDIEIPKYEILYGKATENLLQDPSTSEVCFIVFMMLNQKICTNKKCVLRMKRRGNDKIYIRELCIKTHFEGIVAYLTSSLRV